MVMTGKATAPPPSLVAPAMNEPRVMVIDMNQFSPNRPQRSPAFIPISQRIQTMAAVANTENLAGREGEGPVGSRSRRVSAPRRATRAGTE
jgi:hypothetical protein